MEVATPKANRQSKRYSTRNSILSEYESAMEDSDSSLYYSMTEDSDSSNTDKENANTDWTVTEQKSIVREPRSTKKATPLLRKVLQTNQNPTPRNKHNKRVSFSDSPKPMPTCERVGKVHPKTPRRCKQTDIQGIIKLDENDEVVECQEQFATLMTIEESTVQENTIIETITNEIKVVTLDAAPDVVDLTNETIVDSNTNENIACTMPSYQIPECAASNSDAASDVGSDDRDHSIMENTIIEKTVDPIAMEPEPQPQTEPEPVQPMQPQKTITNDPIPLPIKAKAPLKPAMKSGIAVHTPNKAKSASEIIEEFKKRAANMQTNNATKIARSKLASDTRKSVVPKTSRQTSFRRRSSTYEPRKVDARKTINVLKKVRKSMVKPISEEVKKEEQATTDAAHPSTSKESGSNMEPPKEQQQPAKVATTNLRKPRFTIMGSSRPTLNMAQRVQRRETLFGAAATQQKMKLEAKKPITVTSINSDVAKAVAPTTAKVRPSMAPRGLIKVPSLVTAAKPKPSTAPVQTKAARPQTTVKATVSTALSSSAATATALVAPKLPRKPISHLPKPQTATTQAKPTMAAPVASGAPMLKLNSSAKCTYCDKKFVKEHALNMHLQDKCDKIPATQRRQLLQKMSGSIDSKHEHPIIRKVRASRFIPNDSRFLLDITNEAASGLHQSENSEAAKGFIQLKASMRRLSKAYMGITRTPSKSIKCHICRRAFLNCAEYATHVVEHQASRMEID